MRKINILAFAVLAVNFLPTLGVSQQMPIAGMPSAGIPQQAIRWEASLENAQRAAAQANRPVLIYFCGNSCSFCRRMENEVLSQAAVVNQVAANYVAVSINADRFPTVAQRYGITKLPTTIITTAQGQVLDVKQGYVPVNEYAMRLSQVAAGAKRTKEAAYAQIPPGAIPPTNQQGFNPAIAGQQATNRPVVNPPMTNPPAAPPTEQTYPYPSQPAPVTTAAAPVVPAPYYSSQKPTVPVVQPRQQPVSVPPPSAGSPTIAMDGYCPVSLCEKQQWVRGDKQWGANHRGRIYLFAGPEEQRRFLASPDRYAHVASGNDVVLATEQGQAVPGMRQYGCFCGGQVYLFSSQATMEKFGKDPAIYTRQASDSNRATVNPSPQWR